MDIKIKQDLPTLSKNLKRLRASHHWTQEQVVAKMQIEGCMLQRSTYSKIELGIYPIRLSELEVLKKLYNVSYNDLFQE